MKFIDMFAGIGGFRSGLEAAGHQCVGWIEWNKFARQSYQAIYDTKGQFTASDIQKVKGTDLPDADIWTFGSPCFTSDTLVQTASGLKKIAEVSINDRVLTIDGTLQKVTDTMIHKTKELYSLKVEGNLLLHVTGNHPIYVMKRIKPYWNNARRSYEGFIYDKPKWLHASELKKGDLVKNYGYVQAKNKKEITDEQAWLLGRYVADGYTIHSHRPHRKNSFNHKTIFCVGSQKANKFRKHLITYHANESDSSNKNHSVIKFTVFNEPLMKLAEEFGRGALNKQIPIWVFALPLKQRKLFIAGYNSGDGSVVSNGQYESTTTISKRLALGYAKLVEWTLKRPASIFYCPRPKTYVIEGRTVNQHDTYNVRYRIKDNGKLLLHSKLINGALWKPVRSNKKEILANPVNVYNLEVDENHTYNANGIICHNCQDVSLAGKQAGLIKGKRSSMFFEVIRLLEERIKYQKTLPAYLLMENVKALLSSNGGWDFARVLIEMGKVGYDAEWTVLQSADVVPQNRERVYIVGHLRGKRTSPVFPIQRENGSLAEESRIKVVGNTGATGYKSHDVVTADGISKTVDATAYKHTPQVAIHQIGNYLQTDSFGGNPQVGRVYGTGGGEPNAEHNARRKQRAKDPR